LQLFFHKIKKNLFHVFSRIDYAIYLVEVRIDEKLEEKVFQNFLIGLMEAPGYAFEKSID
jgi:hypothetical protein